MNFQEKGPKEYTALLFIGKKGQMLQESEYLENRCGGNTSRKKGENTNTMQTLRDVDTYEPMYV